MLDPCLSAPEYSTPTFRLRMNLALLDWVSMDAVKLNSCHGNVLCTTSPSSSQSALTGSVSSMSLHKLKIILNDIIVS